MPCDVCNVPSVEEAPQVLLMAPAVGYTVEKLRTGLTRDGFATTEPAPGVLAVRVETTDRRRVARTIRKRLTRMELGACRAVLEPSPRGAFGLESLSRVRSLRTLLARFEADWLLHLLRENRFLSAFQPLVHADDPDRVLGYESLLRGRLDSGRLVEAYRIFGTARDAELLHTLDRLGRSTAVRDIQRLGDEPKLFVNFSPAALFDRRHCMNTTHEAVRRAGIPPERIVFEVVESDEIEDVDHLVRVVRTLQRQGYGIALDDFGSGFASPTLMNRLAPDYVKLDMGLVRGVDADPYKQVVVGRLLQLVRDLGIANVCEGVETRAEMDWLVANGAQYLQGFAFARPHPVPPVPHAPA